MYRYINWSGLVFNIYSIDQIDLISGSGLYGFVAHRSEFPPTSSFQLLYVGQSTDIRNRLSTHEKWQAALALGMNEVHVHFEGNFDLLVPLEQNLISFYQPPLNLQN